MRWGRREMRWGGGGDGSGRGWVWWGRGEDGGGLGSLPSSPRGIKYNCKQPNKWGCCGVVHCQD